MEIAQEIVRQLGGYARLSAMIGAKAPFVGLPDGVRFQFMRAANGINMVEIRLNGRDLYDVRFMKQRGYQPARVVEDANDVYADMLPGLFRDVTGLALQIK